MHIVRNAMDHGIESPAQRKAQHKPQTGIITLKAKHDGGNIVIAISDDGGGLDLERIRKKQLLITLLKRAVASVHKSYRN